VTALYSDIDIGAVISYWQTSLIDGDLAAIALTPDNHVRVPQDDIEAGRVLPETAAKLFKMADVPIDASTRPRDVSPSRRPNTPEQTIPVLVAPLMVAGSRLGTSFVCPLWIPGRVTSSGYLRISEDQQLPWIARQHLELTNSDLVVGTIDDLDRYLTRHAGPYHSDDKEAAWRGQYTYALDMLAAVAGKEWRRLFTAARYTVNDRAAILPLERIRGVSFNIERVYESMLHSRVCPPLLHAYMQLMPDDPEPALARRQWSAPARRHVGSFQQKFPLSPSQREALYHFLLAPPGSILAVDGPPGTGKTTLLHSVITSLWVTAALRQEAPPVIVVSSTNNQAVTNVLDSLNGLDSIQRWLPQPVEGIGVYLTNDKAKRRAAELRGIPTLTRYDEGFAEYVQHTAYVDAARAQYLQKCAEFYRRPVSSLSDAVRALHNTLHTYYGLMLQGLDLADELVPLRAEVNAKLGPINIMMSGAVEVEEELTRARKESETWQFRLNQWRQLPGDGRVGQLLSHLGLSRAVAKKQPEARAAFLEEHFPHLRSDQTDKEFEAYLKDRLSQAQEYEKEIEAYADKQAQLVELEAEWREWCQHVKSDVDLAQIDVFENRDGSPNAANLHNFLDRTVRFRLFEVALHYWEGRWLQDVDGQALSWTGRHEGQDKQSQEEKWRRYAMLTPCFVTTMHTGPGFFDYFDGEAHPLFGMIDLLIVDEAGQVSPEVSGAMFALAKQALVVGDVLQIEPVWGVTEAVDRGNLQRAGLLNERVDWRTLHEKGLTASTGSVMRMAQSVSPYQLPSNNGVRYERGMFLAEHRRSVPEVIAYNNKLAYHGRLRPMRPSLTKHPWPHLGYAHIKGESTLENGSRKNVLEAKALVQWLVDSRASLEAHYSNREASGKKKDIAEIVGIVTPFVAQNRAIQRELAAAGLDGVKTGTVHTFQGGERDVMLFSSVYSGREKVQRYFFDCGVNMLNVAVSRARDSFLVFGDMDIFDPAEPRPKKRANRDPAEELPPSAQLAQFLFAREENELNPSPIPVRVGERPNGVDVHLVNTLDRHVRTLARAFEHAKKRLVIVSPFVRWPAVAADNLAAKTAAAVRRGVDVVIYLDDTFNKGEAELSAEKAIAALSDSGATIEVCHNIHSKVICIDESVFIEGSFNWLSAARDGEYRRHEMSIIYTGRQAKEFIRQTIEDLEQRVVADG
jgi:hypothetical protein